VTMLERNPTHNTAGAYPFNGILTFLTQCRRHVLHGHQRHSLPQALARTFQSL
jgi:hypothetical protein